MSDIVYFNKKMVMHVEYFNQFVKMNYTRKNVTKTKNSRRGQNKSINTNMLVAYLILI